MDEDAGTGCLPKVTALGGNTGNHAGQHIAHSAGSHARIASIADARPPSW